MIPQTTRCDFDCLVRSEADSKMSDFDHDVFISYAFVDDRDGWVQAFDRHFESYLSNWIGRADANRVFFANDNVNNDHPLHDQILGKVRRSRLLLILLSKGYVESDWCRKEREAFLQAFPNALNEKRVILVDLGTLGLASRPSEFSDLVGNRFYVPDVEEPDRGRRFGFPIPDIRENKHRSFFESIDDLAKNLEKRLAEMKLPFRKPAELSSSATTNSTEAPSKTIGIPYPKVRVFIAQATGDVSEKRDEVARYLADHFTVLPSLDEEFPHNGVDWNKLVRESIDQADFYVQLAGAVSGKPLPGNTHRPVPIQFQWARELNKPMALWRSIDPDDVADPALQEVLLAAEYCQTLQEFKEEIVRRAKPVAPVIEKPVPFAQDDDYCNIFIQSGIEDAEQASQLAEMISQHNCFAQLPLTEGSPEEIRRDLEENLDNCDGLIVVYGKVSQRVIRAQFQDLPKHLFRRKEKGLTRPKPALAIFDGEPAPKSPPGIFVPGLQWISRADPQFPTQLAQWVKAIRNGGIS